MANWRTAGSAPDRRNALTGSKGIPIYENWRKSPFPGKSEWQFWSHPETRDVALPKKCLRQLGPT